MRLSSSQVSWPNSVAHSCPRASNARPCTLRCPIVHTGLPVTGLPGAGLPSGVIRRILPPSDPRSWASWSLPVSPVETNSVAVRGEQQPSAVVDEAVGDAGQHRLRRAEPPAGVPHGDDAVVAGGAEVAEDQPVPGVRRRGGQPEEPRLALRLHALDASDRADLPVLDRDDAGGVALADQGGAVGQERDAPRGLQVRRDRAHHVRPAGPLGRSQRRGRGGRRLTGPRGRLRLRLRGAEAVRVAVGGGARGEAEQQRQHDGGEEGARPGLHLGQPTGAPPGCSTNETSSWCTAAGCSICTKCEPRSSTYREPGTWSAALCMSAAEARMS